jgi:XRE family transcriptional regulator, aerobic/anaerobic benzoate catabolism transcriptional regulator
MSRSAAPRSPRVTRTKVATTGPAKKSVRTRAPKSHRAATRPAPKAAAGRDEREPLLLALGERARSLRARRGLTRKAVAQLADVSERHLANLESGTGNASILILQQVAQALQCSLAELVGDVTTSSPEWLLIRELLEPRSEADLRRARIALAELFGTRGDAQARSHRIALVGLRGAGKSTLGQMLADDLDYPFVELSREIEKFAGCTIREIHDLYGTNAYRRYERRALEEAIQIYPEVVIATPGGIVSDAATFNELLAHCTSVWLQAEPEDHMQRVAAQGDMRPMAASAEAMDDLKRILAGRLPFYAKADLTFDTSAQPLEQAFQALRALVRRALQLPP